MEHKLIAHLLIVINSANDSCMSCENFVKFDLITPELTELICEHQVRHGQKNPAHFVKYLRIYCTDFRNLFIILKALYVHMMDLYLIFQFVKGRCHGNQITLL